VGPILGCRRLSLDKLVLDGEQESRGTASQIAGMARRHRISFRVGPLCRKITGHLLRQSFMPRSRPSFLSWSLDVTRSAWELPAQCPSVYNRR